MEKLHENDILAGLKNEIQVLIEGMQSNKLTLSRTRSELQRIRKSALKWSDVKNYGLTGVPDEVRDDASKLVQLAKDIGLYIVPVGELERWIQLSEENKSKWVIAALKEIDAGKCPLELKDFVREVIQ